MKKKSVLALTLGLGLAAGSFTIGTSTIVHANQKPAGIQNMQTDHEKSMQDRPIPQEILTLLQIDEQTFKQEQSSGKSLAQIAAAHNVPRQAVVDLVVKDMNQQIDKGLAEKRITVVQANEMKANAVEQAQKVVDGQPIGTPIPQEILTLLQIDEQTFEQEQSSGKSLAQIAAAHNVSRQAVVDLVVKDMNQQIDKGLAEKRITVAQANEMKANAVEEAQKVVDKKMVGQPANPQR
ncbi:hypothetical protein [Pelosinus baikalensis]|uniref:Uncharacterized protein n=1 Tax=Pelosinus baikalensis TaxID=2892015 RepID=A0ABS8HVN1_9FIRM|nr:hypothetical protein [Pelosinus baikalensis]MCC5467223.1 hypothetical protein [Pelosinus baikalensis]